MYDTEEKREEFQRKASAAWYSLDVISRKSQIHPTTSFRKVYTVACAFQQAMRHAGFKDYTTRLRIWSSPIHAKRWCAPRTSEEITLYGVFYIGLSNELRCYVCDEGVICAYVQDNKHAEWNTPIKDDSYLVDELLVPKSARKRILFEASNGVYLRQELFKKLYGAEPPLKLNAEHLAFARMGLTAGMDDASKALRFCVNASRYGFPVSGYLLEAVNTHASKALNIVSYQ